MATFYPLSFRLARRFRFVGLFVAAMMLVCLNVAIAQIAVAQPAAVTIEGFQFKPAEITVKKGGTLTFTNKDATVHTADSDSGNGFMGTGRLAAGQSKAIVFNTVGAQAYHCAIHPSMTGKVTVVQ